MTAEDNWLRILDVTGSVLTVRPTRSPANSSWQNPRSPSSTTSSAVRRCTSGRASPVSTRGNTRCRTCTRPSSGWPPGPPPSATTAFAGWGCGPSSRPAPAALSAGQLLGQPFGPTISTNPGGTGVRLNGAPLYDPWDRTGATCRDEPPVPPVDVSSLEVTADPDQWCGRRIDRLADGPGADVAGAPVAGAEVVFTWEPAVGTWAGADRCTTGADGRCRVQYVAPQPAEALPAVWEVVVTVGAEGRTGETRIALVYLSPWSGSRRKSSATSTCGSWRSG